MINRTHGIVLRVCTAVFVVCVALVQSVFSDVQSMPVQAQVRAALSTFVPEDTPYNAGFGTNGEVWATLVHNNTLYVGGDFTHIGSPQGYMTVLDATTGDVSSSTAPDADNSVSHAIADGLGGWYIAGPFTKVGGLSHSNLSHILPDGSVDAAWVGIPGGQVNTLLLDGSVLYIGGNFTTVNGVTRNRLAALNATTGALNAWNPSVTNGSVSALAVDGGTLYVGGTFTTAGTIGGQARNRLAAVDTTTGLATAWNPNPNNSVLTIDQDATTIYAGGTFTNIGGQSRTRIGAVDKGTGLATAWNPGSTSAPAKLVRSGTNLFVSFSSASATIAGVTRAYMAKIHTLDSGAEAWNAQIANGVSGFSVNDFFVDGASVYIAGTFTAAGGAARLYVAKVDDVTGTAMAFDPPILSDTVRSIDVVGSNVFIGGNFQIVDGVERHSLAAFDTNFNLLPWNPSGTQDVSRIYSMTANGSTIYVGGDFHYELTPVDVRNNLMAIHETTGAVLAWNPTTTDFIQSMEYHAGNVYVAGDFTSAGGQARNAVAAIDATTGLATAWNPNVTNPGSPASNNVWALKIDLAHNLVYFGGGDFTHVGGVNTISGTPVANLAAVDLTTGALVAGFNANNDVYNLVLRGTDIVALGLFTSVASQARTGFAQISNTTLTAYAPTVTSSRFGGLYDDGNLYVGGFFNSFDGATYNGAVLIDSLNVPNAWNPGFNALNFVRGVYTFSRFGNYLVVGGSFTSTQTEFTPNVVVFADSGAAPPAAPSSGTSNQRLYLPTPVITTVEVIDDQSVRYTWELFATNQNGFRVFDEQGNEIAEIRDSSARSFVETGLPSNTTVSSRTVRAYNTTVESDASNTSSPVITQAKTIQPSDMLLNRLQDQIIVTIGPLLTNGEIGLSGLECEALLIDTDGGTSIQTYGWVQSNQYVFSDIDSILDYHLRCHTRNQQGVVTDWSSMIISEGVGEGVPLVKQIALELDLQVTATSGASLDNELNPNDHFHVEMRVSNQGVDTAENVLLSLPIPDYIEYIPGTLIVDGVAQSDAADEDLGLADSAAVSAIWPVLPFAFGHTVRFQIGFDVRQLSAEYLTAPPLTSEPSIEILPGEDFFARMSDELEVVLAEALTSVNPFIVLQAVATHMDSDVPTYSARVEMQPDLTVLQPVVDPIVREQPIDTIVVETPQTPTIEELTIIEVILEEIFPQPSDSAPVASIPTGVTTGGFNGGAFNLTTTNADDVRLTIDGFANTEGDQITFTGTSSAPFTIITLIFNSSITSIVVSDAFGNWQTFVTAEQLNIPEGETKRVLVEAIAGNGELISERVLIADMTVQRGISGQIVADFETTVSEQGFISLLRINAERIEQTVSVYEPEIQTTLVVSAPVIIVSSAPLWGYLPYAPTLIYHFISWMFGFIARKRKDSDVSTYGVVYDAITKLPLALAIIRIYNQTDNKLASTIVTDKLGRFDVLLASGQYRLEVSKPQYQYPSSIVTTGSDGMFDRIYNKQTGFSVTEQTTALPHVPVDPVNSQRQWQLSFGFKKLWLAFQRAGNVLTTPIILVGLFMSLALLYAVPSKPSNWIIAGLYALTLAIQFKLKPKLIKAWGVVYDVASNAILPLVTIQLIEPATSKVVTTRLSDYEGRFTFLPEPGSYVVKASKPGFSQVTEVVQSPFGDRQPLPPTINIKKPSERVSGDVPMKQGS